ncbi:soluble methane monooxygenase-binding protein MmoD [Methylocystis heyeri]|uniref:Soluble methane monooxygenase-binding protein MmoD n=1 Tax=Methylocystis heyeri TaxID=391905 RepID=A0A6B8KIS3_9HYPH|nr:soluble methane monooxygenase-binding protein MmoD [Methylocystis heyeri]QGM46795.1 soluble methane monooxygenase-binding protein MmoD [Methylocystis heyeri]
MQPSQNTNLQDKDNGAGLTQPIEPTFPNAILIYADSRYAAHATDLDYMWHWEIRRDGEFVQEGCSLSESSSREAVAHVIRHFELQEQARAQQGGYADAIRELLLDVGVAQFLSRDESTAPVEPR